MKNRIFLAICLVLFSAIFTGSCQVNDSQPSSMKSFAYDLRGKWESNDKTKYSGKLVIDYDTITIDGYTESQSHTPQDGSVDNKLPFMGYPKGVPLKGYSEDGKIFIDYGSGQNGISYTFTEPDTYPYKNRLLTFSFGGRDEILEYK